jgi:GNAT superfamily N-acetyltransferase
MSMTRRRFLTNAAVVAAPALLPSSLFAAPDPLGKIDASWAEYFGCSVRDLHGDRTVVVPHKELWKYPGAFAFRHAESCIVSVPHTVTEVERSALRAATPAQVFDSDFLAKVFVVRPELVRPPVQLLVADRAAFTPVASEARLLGHDDLEAIEMLAIRCKNLLWYCPDLSPSRVMLGLFQGSVLVAASGYLVVKKVFASISVLVQPEHWGRGLERMVIPAAVGDAFEKGLVPCWYAPEAKKPALALGRSLGFQPYASTMVVQLQEDEF